MEELNPVGALRTPASRRRLLQGAAVAGAAAFLAACGGGGTATEEPTPGGSSTVGPTVEPTVAEVPIEGPLNFANWPAYIDLTEDETSSPTLEAFKAEYGIEVNYVEDIQANEDFVATITQALDAGLDTGWDLMVLTDYMAARLVRKVWLDETSPSNRLPAAANLRGALRGLAWDPDQKFHYPRQSGGDRRGSNRGRPGRDRTPPRELSEPG